MSIRLKTTFFISLALTVALSACGDSTTPATTTSTTTTISSATIASATTPGVTTASATTASATTVSPTTATTTISSTTTATTTTSAATTQVGQSDTERGLVLFRNQGCANCHGGDKATGKLGPALNNLNFGEDGLLRQVRSGAAPMPAYAADKLTDSDVQLIYSYLISLKGK